MADILLSRAGAIELVRYTGERGGNVSSFPERRKAANKPGLEQEVLVGPRGPGVNDRLQREAPWTGLKSAPWLRSNLAIRTLPQSVLLQLE